MISKDENGRTWDVVIVGTGAAALTAALSAISSKPDLKTLLIDKAPEDWAGGNGYFTAAAYRVVHDGLQDLLPLVSNVSPGQESKIDLLPYTTKNYQDDLDRLTSNRSDPQLSKALIEESLDTVRWLKDVGGVDWWLSFARQSYEVDGRTVFWGGLHLTVKDGGKGLVADLLAAVRKAGCEIQFDTAARSLVVQNGEISGLTVEKNGETHEISANSVILCAGGFEASPDLRKKYLGPGWEHAHTRGTPFNTGDMLIAASKVGAQLCGDLSFEGCHSVSWDADSPKGGGDRVKTNEFTKNGYPFGLMINANGQRFVDEGSDLRNYTYAKNGRVVLRQPKGIAWQVWDSDALSLLKKEEYRDEVCRKTWGSSIAELASALTEDGLDDAKTFVETIEAYNAAVTQNRTEFPDQKFNPAIKDGLSTQSSTTKLALPKSNWALPIVKAPFMAVKITTGITFTFAGLKIRYDDAAVKKEDGSIIPGLFCAGEMVGGLFYGNYPGGSGLTSGAVFGRRAGRAAARRAASKR